MSRKLNCWEFKNCGREKGGLMASALGECPVSLMMKYDGMNDGLAAGRACWMVPNSACYNNNSQRDIRDCYNCEFYKRVVFEQEEKTYFKFTSIKK